MLRYVAPVVASALIIVAALGATNARSQPADRTTVAPSPQPVRVAEKPVGDTEATKPAPTGMDVQHTSNGGTTAHVNLPSTNAVTTSCKGSSRTNTRVAMMKHMAVYSHCDFP